MSNYEVLFGLMSFISLGVSVFAATYTLMSNKGMAQMPIQMGSKEADEIEEYLSSSNIETINKKAKEQFEREYESLLGRGL